MKDKLFGDHESIIPNPADLAQSFLQTEPTEEKEELQAAISSRSETLHRTSTSISDDEEELGLGNESLSLPSFVAAFLGGVGDRLQVHVDDILLRLDVETKQEGSLRRQPEEKPDLISGLLSIREVAVGAVSTTFVSDEHSTHLGKRPVSLSGIDLSLISEPVVFSNYSRFAAPESPSLPSRSKLSQPSSPASSVPPESSSASSSTHAMMESTIFHPSQHSVSSSHDELEGPNLERSAYTSDGRFSDADTEETRSHGHLERSQGLSEEEKLLDNPAYLDSLIDGELQEDDLEGPDGPSTIESDQFESPRSTSRSQDSAPQDPVNVTRANSAVASSEPNVRNIQRSFPAGDEQHPQSSMPSLPSDRTENISAHSIRISQVIPESPFDTSGSDSASEYFHDDLSESKVFSHEDAQSMYMSAMSGGGDSRTSMPMMPGAWESSDATLTGTSHHSVPPSQHDGAKTDQDDLDRTPISTPRATDHGEYPLGHTTYDSPHASYFQPRGKDAPASDLNKESDVAKSFLRIDRITVWLPRPKQGQESPYASDSFHNDESGSCTNDSTAQLDASHIGEKSVSFSETLPLRGHHHGADSAFAVADAQSDAKRGHGSPGGDRAISIEISSAEIRFDIAIGWLILKFGHRILQAFGGTERSNASKAPPKEEPQHLQAFNLTMRKLAVKFVEHVPETSFPQKEQQDDPTMFFDSLNDDVIFQSQVCGVKAHYLNSSHKTRLSATVSKITLGYANEDLISFSEDLKMRESTRDIMSPVGSDLSFSLSKSPESAILTLSTLPICVNLNIQRLEEAFGWFGGLSTIMELGNSISSMSGNRTPKKGVSKARGVRFEGLPPPAKPQSASVQWKVNARVGGIALDVAGENHYLTLRTTAAKVVSRPEAIALQIDKSKLSGPFSLHDTRDAPAKISLDSIRVDFLGTPKDPDLDRLIALITPSKAKYDEDDDIMIGTLLRQRRQGSLLRVTVAGAKVVVTRPEIAPLQQLGEELAKLSNVTKYLPEDDRPGILTLAMIHHLEASLHVGGKIGTITANLENAEAAHISIPSLVAASLGSVDVARNGTEELVGEALAPISEAASIPVLMVRFIADEMDPTIKVKLHNLRFEYTVPAIMAFFGISEQMTSGDVAANMASSLANIAELHPTPEDSHRQSPVNPVKPIKLDIAIRDCIVGLNPRGTAARGLVVLNNSSFNGAIQDISTSEATVDLRKASVLIIDDVDNVDCGSDIPPRSKANSRNSLVETLINMGYVSVSSISSATAAVKIMRLAGDGTRLLDIEVRDDLLILETCADSTQTLISILSGLQPPSPPSTTEKYRTEVVPVKDVIASFSGDAFPTNVVDESPEIIDQDSFSEEDETGGVGDLDPDDPASGFYQLNANSESTYQMSSSISELDFQDDHFTRKSSVGGTAHRWDFTQNTYGLSDDSKLQNSPLRVRVRDAHVIWNLFDGYDWQRTRDTISKAVKDVERKAAERRVNRASPSLEEEPEPVIGDCLFNSVYIDIPANRDMAELRGDINRNIDDLVSETGSYATTSTVTTARRSKSPSAKGKRLRLSRSKSHKMTFELGGICADLVVFPPGEGETINSIDVRINELEIFDHVPTSTWKKFATYLIESGEKEIGTSMVHLETLTVKPVLSLAASEFISKVNVIEAC